MAWNQSAAAATQGQKTLPAHQAGTSTASAGQFRGEAVTPLPMRGVRAEAESSLEELTFKADQYKQRKDSVKPLQTRRMGFIVATTKADNAEKGNNYLRLFNAADRLTLRNLMTQIHSLKKPTVAQLRQLAQGAFGDVSLQYAALDIIRAELKRRRLAREKAKKSSDIDSEQEDQLEEAMAQLMVQEGPAVRAGLNISSVTGQFAGQALGGAQRLRNFYRNSVLNYDGITPTYRGIVKQYGEKNFVSSLAFLLRALGVDMAAQESSRDPTRLQAIVNDMFCVKTLGGIHEQTGELVVTLRQYHQQADCKESQQLMSNLLTLKEDSWPQAKRFFELGERMSICGADKIVYFLQQVKRLLRLIPLKAYDELDMRDKLLAVAQQAIDEAVIREEEALT